MGNYNINLLNTDTHLPSSEFFETTYSHSFIPLINKQIRVTKNSATVIDNVFCNNLDNSHHKSGIFYTDISDHFPIFCIYSGCKYLSQEEYAIKRLFSTKNLNKFPASLQQVNWVNSMSSKIARMHILVFMILMLNYVKNVFL